MFQEVGLFETGEYPFSVSVADLETATTHCDGPDEFLHYIEKLACPQGLYHFES
jgi:hypothetical protein